MADDQCDRCEEVPAVARVRCAYGCTHRRCARCARETVEEVEREAFWREMGEASGV